jgi:hypothetical protein
MTDDDLFWKVRENKCRYNSLVRCGKPCVIVALVCRVCGHHEDVANYRRGEMHFRWAYYRARNPMRRHFHEQHPEEWRRISGAGTEAT